MKLGLFSSTNICCNDEHQLNRPLPIVVTELGMVTEVSLVHSLNAPLPIVITELGMVIDVSLEQP